MGIVRKTLDLITYGCGSEFDRSKFMPIENSNFIKPHGGLWASPVSTSFGWADWCKAENYGDLSTSFTFRITGKILVINSLRDAKSMPWLNLDSRFMLMLYPDYERMAASDIDAIHLTLKGEHETRFSHPHSLYGWDCESVLVMNCNRVLIEQPLAHQEG